MNILQAILFASVIILVAGYIPPSRLIIPVAGATEADWSHDSFWYEPWGASVVHKGVDIFGRPSQAVIAPSECIVFFAGDLGRGGNSVACLGWKWRVHIFLHLSSIETYPGAMLGQGDTLGFVGDTGNAKGKPPHLHYEIITPIPLPWRMDDSTQGWKKAFHLDPTEELLR